MKTVRLLPEQRLTYTEHCPICGRVTEHQITELKMETKAYLIAQCTVCERKFFYQGDQKVLQES